MLNVISLVSIFSIFLSSNIHCYDFFSRFQYNLKYYTISLLTEQCDKRWVSENIYDLEYDLAKYVFGQDLAIEEIMSALRRHARNSNPKKPLVLNFHGWPGGGKGYVAEFIVKHWFKEKTKSHFVKTYHAKLDFPLANDIYLYQERLQRELESTVRLCSKSMFIFDEVDKYPPHVLDGLKPYLDYNSAVRGIDFRNAIFIFITNNGESIITNITLQKYLDGVPRTDLQKKDFEYALRTATFNDEGGFYRSDLIRHHLIDVVVPFLPLERDHVESCIHAEMKLLDGDPSVTYDVIKEIMNEITFGPPSYEVYSVHGCKGVHEKVAAILERHWRRKRRNDL